MVSFSLELIIFLTFKIILNSVIIIYMNRRIFSLSVLIFIFSASLVSCSSTYAALDVDIKSADGNVRVEKIKEGFFIDGPGTRDALVFYPGAKVDCKAYVPLMTELSSKGIDCFILKMPMDLALFGQNKCEKIFKKYSYKNYFLGGHSLGGAVSTFYANRKPEKLQGLMLFAAYPTKKISDKLFVISVYGTDDKVLNMNRILAGREYMPERYFEYSIGGGNHANFGNYGHQKGDGEASIPAKEQQTISADYIINCLENLKNK